MIIAESHIHQVAVDVCHVMLGMNVKPFEKENPPRARCFAYIDISGSEDAIVEISVCETAANEIAGAMFGSEGNLAAEEIADAVSELANMVGGNLKCLLGVDCRLSIPKFQHLRDLTFDSPTEQNESQVGDGWLRIALQRKSKN